LNLALPHHIALYLKAKKFYNTGVMTEEWIETHNDIKLFLRKWKPEGSARALIYIIHGMQEHSARYGTFAEFLCANGFEVWCADLRGHGLSADENINPPNNGGLLGHLADEKGTVKVLNDINKIIEKMQENEIPIFLFGHSWGSFLAQGYIEFFKTKLAGCILSGTRGPNIEANMGASFLRFFSIISGVQRRSSFVNSMMFGSYDKYFAPVRTDCDWLSRDNNAVDAYIADPLCGKLPTVGFFRDLTALLKQIHRNRNIEKINRDLPIYIFAGSKDPVGGMGENITALAGKYTHHRIKDLEFVLYPDARHECINEINKDEVMTDILKWLEKHI
jgi:alpha-beta hydrolase superfamily lysophospholipase